MEGELEPKLPTALLESVFARLPTDAIGRIGCLSKEWKQAVSTCSTFTRLCSEFQPNLCGMVGFKKGLPTNTDTTSRQARRCWVTLYDTDARKWLHPLSSDDIMSPLDGELERYSKLAGDGGLVCMVRHACGEGGILGGPMVVLNPLTRQWRQLPLNRVVRKYRTVQLKVDRNTGMYKIFIVGYMAFDDFVIPEAEVYDSGTNEWSTLENGLILASGPQVYDCSTGQFRWYHPPPRAGDLLGRVTENDLYSIHLNDLYIAERLTVPSTEDETPYTQFAVCKYEEDNWRFGRDGSQEVARFPAVYECKVQAFGETSLFVSGTFFMVYEHSPERPEKGYEMMLYDMKKGEWYHQDNRVYTLLTENFEHPFTCELRWDARP